VSCGCASALEHPETNRFIRACTSTGRPCGKVRSCSVWDRRPASGELRDGPAALPNLQAEPIASGVENDRLPKLVKASHFDIVRAGVKADSRDHLGLPVYPLV
jgi:hypothetical protein